VNRSSLVRVAVGAPSNSARSVLTAKDMLGSVLQVVLNAIAAIMNMFIEY